MKLSRHRQQQFAACFAMLAMLLLFVAPVVSKSQMMMSHAIGTAQETMSASDMPMMAMADHGTPADHQQHDTGMMAGEIACGYCDLLIHMPLMIWLFVPLTWLLLLLRQRPRPPETSAPLPPHYSLSHPPRGPPDQLCF